MKWNLADLTNLPNFAKMTNIHIRYQNKVLKIPNDKLMFIKINVLNVLNFEMIRQIRLIWQNGEIRQEI